MSASFDNIIKLLINQFDKSQIGDQVLLSKRIDELINKKSDWLDKETKNALESLKQVSENIEIANKTTTAIKIQSRIAKLTAENLKKIAENQKTEIANIKTDEEYRSAQSKYVNERVALIKERNKLEEHYKEKLVTDRAYYIKQFHENGSIRRLIDEEREKFDREIYGSIGSKGGKIFEAGGLMENMRLFAKYPEDYVNIITQRFKDKIMAPFKKAFAIPLTLFRTVKFGFSFAKSLFGIFSPKTKERAALSYARMQQQNHALYDAEFARLRKMAEKSITAKDLNTIKNTVMEEMAIYKLSKDIVKARNKAIVKAFSEEFEKLYGVSPNDVKEASNAAHKNNRSILSNIALTPFNAAGKLFNWSHFKSPLSIFNNLFPNPAPASAGSSFGDINSDFDNVKKEEEEKTYREKVLEYLKKIAGNQADSKTIKLKDSDENKSGGSLLGLLSSLPFIGSFLKFFQNLKFLKHLKGIKSFFSEKFTKFWTRFKNWFKGLKIGKFFTNIFSGIKDAITNSIRALGFGLGAKPSKPSKPSKPHVPPETPKNPLGSAADDAAKLGKVEKGAQAGARALSAARTVKNNITLLNDADVAKPLATPETPKFDNVPNNANLNKAAVSQLVEETSTEAAEKAVTEATKKVVTEVGGEVAEEATKGAVKTFVKSAGKLVKGLPFLDFALDGVFGAWDADRIADGNVGLATAASIIAGSGKGLGEGEWWEAPLNVISNGIKWGIAGTAAGAPFAGVGAIPGAIAGTIFGITTGIIGPERTAAFLKSLEPTKQNVNTSANTAITPGPIGGNYAVTEAIGQQLFGRLIPSKNKSSNSKKDGSSTKELNMEFIKRQIKYLEEQNPGSKFYYDAKQRKILQDTSNTKTHDINNTGIYTTSANSIKVDDKYVQENMRTVVLDNNQMNKLINSIEHMALNVSNIEFPDNKTQFILQRQYVNESPAI